MRGRTGMQARWFISAPGSGGCGVVLLNAFVGLLVFGALFAMLIGGFTGVSDVLDPDDAVYRLGRPVSAAEQRAGVRRVGGTIDGPDDGLPTLCKAHHQHYVSGKNGGWRTDYRALVNRGAMLRTSTGEVLLLSALPGGTEFVPEFLETTHPWTGFIYEFNPDMPRGGRVIAHCLVRGDRVFVEGCADSAGAIGSCTNRPLEVTHGDGTPQRRIDYHANILVAKVTLVFFALLLIVLYVWNGVRARPLTATLIQWGGPVTYPGYHKLVWFACAGLPVCALLTELMHRNAMGDRGTDAQVYRLGYVFALTVGVGFVALAFAARRRRDALTRAMNPIVAAPTVPLSHAFQGPVELAVAVSTNAPVVYGALDPAPHAFLRVTVDRIVQEGRNSRTYHDRTICWPQQIPVRDGSGEGMLDLSFADFDLRAERRAVRGNAAAQLLARYAQTPVGAFGIDPYCTYVVEESRIDPGELLYVLGHARRVNNPEASSGYRSDMTLPVVGGAEGARLIVHAGSERSLLKTLTAERTWLDLVGVASVGTAAVLASVSLLLALR